MRTRGNPREITPDPPVLMSAGLIPRDRSDEGLPPGSAVKCPCVRPWAGRYGLLLVSGILLVTEACGGTTATDPATDQSDSGAGTVATVIVTPDGPSLAPTDQLQLTATARDRSGKVLAGKAFRWSSATPLLAHVSQSGLVTAQSVGVVLISATETSTGAAGTTLVRSVAAARRPGSILDVRFEQGLAQISLTVLGSVDTAAAGTDQRLALVRTAAPGSFSAPVARADWPLLRAVAECPDGNVYASENSTGNHGDRLWELDPRTGVASLLGEVSIGPYDIESMACDPPGLLFVAEFADYSMVYSVEQLRPLAAPRLVRGIGTARVLGVARSNQGSYYATARTSGNLSSAQRLATLNPSNGALSFIGVGSNTPDVKRLEFRGSRLLGMDWAGGLVDINVQTGSMVRLRSAAIP